MFTTFISRVSFAKRLLATITILAALNSQSAEIAKVNP